MNSMSGSSDATDGATDDGVDGTGADTTGTGDSGGPPICGNGVVEVGEECDGQGPSMECDGDCTLVVCGDGVVNLVAGEECDDRGESARCDADCTAVSCGDGLWNASSGEECDTGGKSASCDVDCTLALCGDATFNAQAGEECDAGGKSARCDVDCTLVSCGDGVTNAAAGEDCDGAGETADCNLDCTSASCGDGITNATAGEGCDDAGESISCDDDCTLASCGDGLVNATAGEDCDDGGQSMTCDLDCTPALCGDGTINGDAGEDCEPGDLGGATCITAGFGSGVLACDGGCAFDTSGCITGPPLPGSLILWLLAEHGVTSGPDGVTLWEDQSPVLNDASQAGLTAQPELIPAQLNGLPVIRFDGDDTLGLGAPMFLDDLTILIVARSNNPGEGFHMILGPGAANNQIRFEGSTELLSVGTGNGLPAIVSPIGDNRVPHSLSIVHDGATWDVFRDGGLASSNPVAVVGPLELGKLGAWFGTQHGLIGDIAEVLIYDVALSEPERLVAEDYLRTKYALP